MTFPNPNDAISIPIDSSQQSSQQSSASSDFCKPIAIADGHWDQITEKKNGLIFGSTE
jgi:predicted nucleotide-binding protein (sugar kinase/HSP70/actin superfamily)